jgi:hypothetical protein
MSLDLSDAVSFSLLVLFIILRWYVPRWYKKRNDAELKRHVVTQLFFGKDSSPFKTDTERNHEDAAATITILTELDLVLQENPETRNKIREILEREMKKSPNEVRELVERYRPDSPPIILVMPTKSVRQTAFPQESPNGHH